MANGSTGTEATVAFRSARDFLQAHREDHDAACQGFRWPDLESFNYATDWVDVLAAEHGGGRALWVIEEDGSETTLTFAEVAALSQRFAGFLKEAGIGPGDRVLLLLGNCAPLWVAMLGCIRL